MWYLVWTIWWTGDEEFPTYKREFSTYEECRAVAVERLNSIPDRMYMYSWCYRKGDYAERFAILVR